jgi:hypothetical protein
MAINYFKGWSREQLEAALKDAQEDLAAGKSTVSAGAGDANSSSKIDKSAEERIKMLLRALHDEAPEDYPLEEVTATNETRIAFTRPANGWDG